MGRSQRSVNSGASTPGCSLSRPVHSDLGLGLRHSQSGSRHRTPREQSVALSHRGLLLGLAGSGSDVDRHRDSGGDSQLSGERALDSAPTEAVRALLQRRLFRSGRSMSRPGTALGGRGRMALVGLSRPMATQYTLSRVWAERHDADIGHQSLRGVIRQAIS